MQGNRSKIKYRADFNEDVCHKDQHGVDQARPAPEPLLQKLGHGVKTVAEVERQKDPEQRVEADENRAPLDAHGHEAASVRGADDADEMVAADVGRDDAAADHPPGQLVAGQEIVALAGPRPAGSIDTQGHDPNEVADEND